MLVPGTPVQMTWTAVLGALVGFTGARGRRRAGRPAGADPAGPRAVAAGAGRAARRRLARPGRSCSSSAALAGLVALRAQGAAGTASRGRSACSRPACWCSRSRCWAYGCCRSSAGPRCAPPARRAGSGRSSPYARSCAGRPGLRLAALLAVAVGLATFAIDGEAVAAGNRDTRAGARGRRAARSSRAVRAAAHDPVDGHARPPTRRAAGRWPRRRWLAKRRRGTRRGARGRLHAGWPRSPTGRPARHLRRGRGSQAVGPPVPAPISFTGTALRVHLTTLSRGPGPAAERDRRGAARPAHPGAGVRLGAAARRDGHVHRRRAVRRRLLADPAGAGTGRSTSPTRSAGSVLVTGVEVQAGSGLAAARRRPHHAGAVARAGSGGPDDRRADRRPRRALRDDFTSTGGASPGDRPRSTRPSRCPLIATPGASSTRRRRPARRARRTPAGVDRAVRPGGDGPAAAGGARLRRPRRRAVRPRPAARLRRRGDLAGLARPERARRRGAAAGDARPARAERPDRRASARDELGRQGPALALLLLVACAIAGAVLAAGATALAVAVTGRRRSFELAALRGGRRAAQAAAAVVRPRAADPARHRLRRSACRPGIVAARLALPAIPEYSDADPGAAGLRTARRGGGRASPSWCALCSWSPRVLAGRALMRSAVPTRLREAAQ